MMKRYLFFIFLLLAKLHAAAQEPIRDNSFLVEEAYNQDAGVVQHIFTGQFDPAFKNADGSFTQEWPAGSMLHQVSYTLPYRFYDGINFSLNDMLINYRYQLLAKDNLFISPRCSFIIPTGQSQSTENTGGTGFQLVVPFSFELCNKISMHVNIGNSFTWYDAQKKETRLNKTEEFSSGLSFIYYITNNLNIMLETVHISDFYKYDSRPDVLETKTIINPGFRFAINFPSGLQIVPGIAAPFDLQTKSSSCYLYLSFEHPLKKKKS